MPKVEIEWDQRGLNKEKPNEVTARMIVNGVQVVPHGMGFKAGNYENIAAFMLDVVDHLYKLAGVRSPV
jgi:hypothetical protein